MKDNIKDSFNLKKDQASNEEIRKRIDSGAQVTGSNMYILICAILIASVGLNMNSTAVVIGAMLISPIMGVLMSMAYAISNQELPMLKSSICKFIFQVAISILTSTIYFLLSPMTTFSGELIARTNPTLWDALIAFFGGFSAVIANTRKSKISNVIPGAAIATALMPPLCTVGYCISSAKWLSAVGAFYLFFINVIFICLSSIIGLRIMKVTSTENFVKTAKHRVMVAIVIAVAIIPSGILAAQTVQESYIDSHYKTFLQEELNFSQTQIVKSNIDVDSKQIEVVLIGEVLDSSEIRQIEKKLGDYGLSGYKMNIVQTHLDNGITKEELNDILNSEESKQNITQMEQDLYNTKKLLEMQTQAKDLQLNTVKELMVLYPKVKSAGFIDLYDKDNNKRFCVVLNVEDKLKDNEIDNMRQWLKTRFKEDIDVVQMQENK